MASYIRYISRGVSVLLIPLVKMAFIKLMDKNSEELVRVFTDKASSTIKYDSHDQRPGGLDKDVH